MKRRTEGALHGAVYSSRSGEDFDELILQALPAFANIEDFLAKAERLSSKHPTPRGSVRAEYVATLRRTISQLRRWIRSGVPSAALDDAVCAALAFSAICAELRDDEKSNLREPITRVEYAASKAEGLQDKAVASDRRMSKPQLSKWKKKNAVDYPRSRRTSAKRRK